MIAPPTNVTEFDSSAKSSIIKEKEANRVLAISSFPAMANARKRFRRPGLHTKFLFVISARMKSQFSTKEAPRILVVHLNKHSIDPEFVKRIQRRQRIRVNLHEFGYQFQAGLDQVFSFDFESLRQVG